MASSAEGEERPSRREPGRASAPGQHRWVVDVGEGEMDRADHHRGCNVKKTTACKPRFSVERR